MKSLFGAMVLLFLALSPAARAEGPDNQYVAIYNLIQQGDALKEGGQAAPALARYVEAETALKNFQGRYPDWNIKVVTYRLTYLSSAIAELKPKTAPPAAPVLAPVPVATDTESAKPPTPVAKEPPKVPDAPSNAEIQVKALQEQLRQSEAERAALESNKVLLEAKLKEALSVRPAASDPRELAKAQEQVRELQKQNELFKVTLNQTRSNQVKADPAALEKSRQSLAEANQKLAQLTAANTALAAEKEALQSKVNGAVRTDPAAAALREENDILKKQVAELKRKEAATAPGGDMSRKLAEAQSQLAALQSDKEILRLEKAALEGRVKQLAQAPAAAPVAAPDTASAEKIKELEAQRLELQKSLDAALKELAGRKKNDEAAAKLAGMTNELESLRARIAIYEAPRVPYTTEELAMISKPEGTALVAAAHASSRRSVRDLPAKEASLLTEGRQHYAAHETDKAEEKYNEALKLDPKNVSILSDLANIQLDLNHRTDAEKNLTSVLAIEPANEYALSLIGRLRYDEGKFDEALEALSRAAQINPQDATTQNYLGITLSQKGLRIPAETALLTAIRINPDFGLAHANLAFVYITQDPPLVELAKWHYEKALAAGQPRNPGIEKRLNLQKPDAVAK